MENPIISFYAYDGRDFKGRTLNHILTEYTDNDLELKHDFIQVLFPLPERSGFNDNAPLITEKVFKAFRKNDELGRTLQKNLFWALERMCHFYGFDLNITVDEFDVDHELKISQSANFTARSKLWLRKFNHNHLRMTRIIRCLRCLNLQNQAKAFHEAIKNATSGIVDEATTGYWDRAMLETRLDVPPDVTAPDGPSWLTRYEDALASERMRLAYLAKLGV